MSQPDFRKVVEKGVGNGRRLGVMVFVHVYWRTLEEYQVV